MIHLRPAKGMNNGHRRIGGQIELLSKKGAVMAPPAFPFPRPMKKTYRSLYRTKDSALSGNNANCMKNIWLPFRKPDFLVAGHWFNPIFLTFLGSYDNTDNLALWERQINGIVRLTLDRFYRHLEISLLKIMRVEECLSEAMKQVELEDGVWTVSDSVNWIFYASWLWRHL